MALQIVARMRSSDLLDLLGDILGDQAKEAFEVGYTPEAREVGYPQVREEVVDRLERGGGTSKELSAYEDEVARQLRNAYEAPKPARPPADDSTTIGAMKADILRKMKVGNGGV